MLKMIVMDLDGTLLNDNKNISTYNISILEKCKDKGIALAFATARSQFAARRIIDIIKPDYIILNEGALITNSNEGIINKKLLSIKTSDGIINDCMNDKNNIINIAVETEKNYYNTYKDFYHQDYNYGIYYDFTKLLHQKAYKISVEIIKEQIAYKICEKYKDCKIISNSGEKYYQYIHKNVSKMIGIDIISKYSNINISEIIAFGDDYNDIEMVKECGIGIAMKNGTEKVKSVAKYICESNNEDGIGKWIEKNIL